MVKETQSVYIVGSHIFVLYDEIIWTSKLSIQINIKSSKFLSFDFLRRPVKKDNFLKESKVVMNWESKMPSPAFLLEILLHFFCKHGMEFVCKNRHNKIISQSFGGRQMLKFSRGAPKYNATERQISPNF